MQLVFRAGLKLGATEMQTHSSNHLARLPPPGDIHCRSITLTPLILLRVLLYTGFHCSRHSTLRNSFSCTSCKAAVSWGLLSSNASLDCCLSFFSNAVTKDKKMIRRKIQCYLCSQYITLEDPDLKAGPQKAYSWWLAQRRKKNNQTSTLLMLFIEGGTF